MLKAVLIIHCRAALSFTHLSFLTRPKAIWCLSYFSDTAWTTLHPGLTWFCRLCLCLADTVSATQVFATFNISDASLLSMVSAAQERRHSLFAADATPRKKASRCQLACDVVLLWLLWIYYIVCLCNLPRHTVCFVDYQNTDLLNSTKYVFSAWALWH